MLQPVWYSMRCLQHRGGRMSYEPPLEDDIALDKETKEDDGYQEPDRMWGDE